MPAPYNLTNVSNSTGAGEFLTAMNGLSGGLIGVTFWASLFFIGFLGLLLRGNTVKNSFAGGSFLSLIVAILMWSSEWLSDWFLIINIVMVLCSIILLRSTSD